MKFALSAWMVTLAIFGVLPVKARSDGQKDRPNVLLIMTDDQGWGDIGLHGAPQLSTPILDRIATGGAQFERFYVSPVCAPTRASLLTGRYNLRTGVFGVTRARETMRSEEITLAETFQAAGYATGAFGKWHNGAHYPNHPNGQGFEEFFGFCAGHWNNYFDTELEHNGKPVATRGFITDVLTDQAIDFVKSKSAAEQPFFCYVPYNAPHSPWQVPDHYYKKYLDLGLPPTTACAYGMVENLDENIGRLMDALKETGVYENTIVVFLTDNGPNSDRFNGGMRGRKGSVHEGGVRVPLFIQWPGKIESGRVVEPIAMHIDLYPTLLDLCGIDFRRDENAPESLALDGVSLKTALISGACPETQRPSVQELKRRVLFSHHVGGGNVREWPGAARTQRWRLVTYGKGYELYDMQADPRQQTNVAARYPEVVRDLSSQYESWFRDVTERELQIPPVPVGSPKFPVVTAPAHESRFEGNVKFMGRAGWANDWFTNWTSTEDQIFWDLDVLNPGLYRVEALYTCPESDVGALVEVSIQEQRRSFEILKAHDPDPIPSPDHIERKEVYEKRWATALVGDFRLQSGRSALQLQAKKIPGAQVGEIKGLRLTILQSSQSPAN